MTAQDLIEGTVLLFDKPYTWTSFNLVNKVRFSIIKHLKIKKLKVGHAGTLDPFATGLLVLCTGKKTKEIESLQATEKEYIATIEFGKTTPSYDLETKFDAEFPYSHVTESFIKEKMQLFLGEIDQVPPVFSAKFIDGKRAYEYARKGTEVEMKANKVTIKELEILSFNQPELVIRIRCNKGTYIRSFAYDLGKAVDSGAYLKGLRRTISGNYNVKDAYSLEKFQEILLALQP
jgi:tRNA pseudouridine55 synthase